jgi:hypothetical protein
MARVTDNRVRALRDSFLTVASHKSTPTGVKEQQTQLANLMDEILERRDREASIKSEV